MVLEVDKRLASLERVRVALAIHSGGAMHGLRKLDQAQSRGPTPWLHPPGSPDRRDNPGAFSSFGHSSVHLGRQ